MTVKQFFVSTRLIMGPGSIRELPTELEKMNAKHILVVTDQGLVKAGILDQVKEQLTNVTYTVYDEVIPNPDVPSVDQAYQQLKDESFDLVLAVGGGSVMDTAKGCATLFTNGGSIRDYIGREKYQNDPTPLFVIPTTVGTGSEVTRACAIKDPRTNAKEIIGGASMASRVAFLDGELLQSLPSSIVAATGMDTLTHAVEGYVSLNATPVTDALNLQAIRMVSKYLRPAVADSGNLEAIQQMLIASTTTGIGFGNAFLGLVHSITHAIGGHYEAPHGILNAIVLPTVLEFNWIGNPRKYAEIAEALGIHTQGMSDEDAAKAGIEYIKTLAEDIGIPKTLRDVGIDDTKMDQLVEQIYHDIYIPVNPRKPSRDEIRRILEACL